MNTKIVTLLSFFIVTPVFLLAQSNTDIIKRIEGLMIKNYVFLDKAKEVNQHLDQLMKEKYFDTFKKPEDFAKALTIEMQKITNDKHLNVAPPRPRNNVQSNPLEFYSQTFTKYRTFSCGWIRRG
jgi:hypothetical protein